MFDTQRDGMRHLTEKETDMSDTPKRTTPVTGRNGPSPGY